MFWIYIFTKDNSSTIKATLESLMIFKMCRVIILDFSINNEMMKILSTEDVEIRYYESNLYDNEDFLTTLSDTAILEANNFADAVLFLYGDEIVCLNDRCTTKEFKNGEKIDTLICNVAVSTNTDAKYEYKNYSLEHFENIDRCYATSDNFNFTYPLKIYKLKNYNEMVTFGFCSKVTDISFFEYLRSVTNNMCHIINKTDIGVCKTLTQGLNEIINEAPTDVVILCHNDIRFENINEYKDSIQNIFLRLFDEKPEYGIIGAIGGSFITQDKITWANGDINGHFVQSFKSCEKDDVYENHGKLIPYDISLAKACVIDGMFIAVKKSRLKTLFNERNKNFHFYDIEFCLENILFGCSVGVTKAILVHHFSEGDFKRFDEIKPTFLNKWKNLLPFTKDGITIDKRGDL